MFLLKESKEDSNDIYKKQKKPLHCLYSYYQVSLRTSKNGLSSFELNLRCFCANGWLAERDDHAVGIQANFTKSY